MASRHWDGSTGSGQLHLWSHFWQEVLLQCKYRVGPVGDVGIRQPIRGWCRRTAQQGRQSGCIRPRKPGQLAAAALQVGAAPRAHPASCPQLWARWQARVGCGSGRQGGRGGGSVPLSVSPAARCPLRVPPATGVHPVHLIRHRIEFVREAAKPHRAGAQHAHHWWLLPSTHSHVWRARDEDDGHLVDVKVSCARARAAAADAATAADADREPLATGCCRRRRDQQQPTTTATSSFAPKDHRHAAVVTAVAKTPQFAGRPR